MVHSLFSVLLSYIYISSFFVSSLETLEQLTGGVNGNSKQKSRSPVANCLSNFITTGDSVENVNAK